MPAKTCQWFYFVSALPVLFNTKSLVFFFFFLYLHKYWGISVDIHIADFQSQDVSDFIPAPSCFGWPYRWVCRWGCVIWPQPGMYSSWLECQWQSLYPWTSLLTLKSVAHQMWGYLGAWLWQDLIPSLLHAGFPCMPAWFCGLVPHWTGGGCSDMMRCCSLSLSCNSSSVYVAWGMLDSNLQIGS